MNGPQLDGKICLVTGATDGMGKATAKALAELGGEVLLVGRNPKKGTEVMREIRQACGHDRVELLHCDLSSQSDIRALAERVNTQFPRLDVLVNNVGGVIEPRRETVDGIEYTWALNQLSYFLLTNLLLEKLKRSAPARIVNVSSYGHQGRIHFSDIEMKRDYSVFGAYMQSKLANIMFTYELDRRLGSSGVTANVLHPGWVGSAFGSSTGLAKRIAFAIARLTFMKRPAQGAETAIYLASSPEIEGVSGSYFADKRAIRSSDESYDEENAKRLWDVCSEMTGLS